MLGLGQNLSSGITLAGSAFSATFDFTSSTEGIGSIGSSNLTIDQTTFDSTTVLRCVDNSTSGTQFIIGDALATNPVTSATWPGTASTPVYARIRFYVPSSNSGIVGVQKGGFPGYYTGNGSVTGTDQWLTWTWTTNTGTINTDSFVIFFETTDQTGTGDVVYVDKIEISLEPLA